MDVCLYASNMCGAAKSASQSHALTINRPKGKAPCSYVMVTHLLDSRRACCIPGSQFSTLNHHKTLRVRAIAGRYAWALQLEAAPIPGTTPSIAGWGGMALLPAGCRWPHRHAPDLTASSRCPPLCTDNAAAAALVLRASARSACLTAGRINRVAGGRCAAPQPPQQPPWSLWPQPAC